MGRYVLDFDEIDQTQVGLTGGKAAALGELSRLDFVSVPAGFCVTTDAFFRTCQDMPSVNDRLERLSRLQAGDREAVREISDEVRLAFERITMPEEVALAIAGALDRIGSDAAYAVRSSATAEDSPTTSFAGQHDSYLDVPTAGVLEHVTRCWGSLFSERAVTYRLRNGLDHRTVGMAVVVQQMVTPHCAGVLFTADPVTGNRKVTAIEATLGLGEALVSGRVQPERYTVRGGEVVATEVVRERPALAEWQIVALADLGRRIEAHLGRPQDIEWCLVDDRFSVVQSRPITTLFPIPAAGDCENHVYVSVGHGQMMTDAMKPLGLSFWQRTAARPMVEAGGRLFVDVTQALGAPTSRARLLELFWRSDPLTGDALRTIIDRGDFIPPREDSVPVGPVPGEPSGPVPADPEIVTELIERTRASVARAADDIKTKSGVELVDFILTDIQELKRILFHPRSHQVVMAGMEATWWLRDRLQAWLGESDAVDTLTQSVPNNVTSEMGLALLDVADAIRPYPHVVAFLEQTEDASFLEFLPALPGGREAVAAITGFLARFGMRCVGEIDITRPRWGERPLTLVPLILTNVRTTAPGEAKRRFASGRENASKKEHDVLERLRALPDGERKAEETKRMIGRVRTFIGFREYPKYAQISRYFLYKQALAAEARRLVGAGVLRDCEDIFYLRLPELREVVRTQQVDDELIRERRAAFRRYEALTPPRVITSDGEVIAGRYRRDGAPAGSLVGLPVSAGTIEGRARVILDITHADLDPGDILVTTYTDPSWSPLFVAVKGLVTEVGGLMTHGAVIAREYGIPALVGVERATELIADKQRIRIHATAGYVELLSSSPR